MKPTIKQMSDWQVVIEWLQNYLAKNYPACTFEITHSSLPRLGVTITCKQTSGQPIDKRVIQSAIDDFCNKATDWHDPEYGILHRKTSRVKGKFILL